VFLALPLAQIGIRAIKCCECYTGWCTRYVQ